MATAYLYNNLHLLCTRFGLRPSNLADAVGMARSTVTRFMLNTSKLPDPERQLLSRRTCEKLANYFKIDPKILMFTELTSEDVESIAKAHGFGKFKGFILNKADGRVLADDFAEGSGGIKPVSVYDEYALTEIALKRAEFNSARTLPSPIVTLPMPLEESDVSFDVFMYNDADNNFYYVRRLRAGELEVLPENAPVLACVTTGDGESSEEFRVKLKYVTKGEWGVRYLVDCPVSHSGRHVVAPDGCNILGVALCMLTKLTPC